MERSTAPSGRQEHEDHVEHRFPGGIGDGEGVGGALHAVALDQRTEVGVDAVGPGLVVDHDQAAGPPVEQVDVALERAVVADRYADVHLAPVGGGGGGDH